MLENIKSHLKIGFLFGMLLRISFGSKETSSEIDFKCLDGCVYFMGTNLWGTNANYTQLTCKIKPNVDFNEEAYENSSDSCGLKNRKMFIIIKTNREYLDSHISSILKVLEYSWARNTYINFYKLKGINVESPLKFMASGRLDFSLIDINFEFFDNNYRSIRTCQDFERLENSTRSHFFDTRYVSSYLSVAISNTLYGKPVCELVFKSTGITQINFYDAYETAIKTNRPRFVQQAKVKYLKSQIGKFVLESSWNLNLDSQFLNAKIFENLVEVNLKGANMKTIQNELFIYFKYLRRIYFEYDTFFKLVKRQGIEWVKSINAGLDIDLDNETQLVSSIDLMCIIELTRTLNIAEYSGVKLYHEKDFCSYIEWPFQQLVFVEYVNSESNYNRYGLSCLTFWLFKYHPRIENISSSFQYLDTIDFTQADKCNFTGMKSLCVKSNYNIKSYHFSSLEFIHISEYLIILSMPIVSLIGIIFNSIVIAVLKNKDFQKEFKEKHYTYMVIFSFSNIMICFFQIMSLINECQQPIGLFCSTIRKSVFIQYYKIIFGEFFLYFFISISNCSYVAFALCRLSLVGNNHSKFVTFVSKLGVKKLVAAFIGFACLFTIVKPFRYKIAELLYGSFSFPDLYYKYVPLQTLNMTIFKLIFISNILYHFVNYCVFVGVVIVIDLVMLKKVRRVMQEKEEKMSEQIQARRDKLKKENEESFNQLIKFVVFNSLINIGLKIPNCITSLNDFRLIVAKWLLYLSNQMTIYSDPLLFPYTMGYLCTAAKVCEIFQLFGHFLYIISLSTNFFFLKRFDRNFNKALATIFDRQKKKN